MNKRLLLFYCFVINWGCIHCQQLELCANTTTCDSCIVLADLKYILSTNVFCVLRYNYSVEIQGATASKERAIICFSEKNDTVSFDKIITTTLTHSEIDELKNELKKIKIKCIDRKDFIFKKGFAIAVILKAKTHKR